ncbi:ROK family protein [Mesobacillus maritimus]|uniref:ROK family protein n=1 Tax=Mesobacillus maritimus TaxID=1643336 RepID=UPI003CCEAB1B
MTLEQVHKILENDWDILLEIEKFGYFLGVGLPNIFNTFNPDSIILRSDLIESNPIILKSIKKAVTKRESRYISLKDEIFISQLNKYAGPSELHR